MLKRSISGLLPVKKSRAFLLAISNMFDKLEIFIAKNLSLFARRNGYVSGFPDIPESHREKDL